MAENTNLLTPDRRNRGFTHIVYIHRYVVFYQTHVVFYEYEEEEFIENEIIDGLNVNVNGGGISDEEATNILGPVSEGIKSDGEEVCPICLDSLNNKSEADLKQLPCQHVYHYSCILQSTKFRNTCPMCRAVYDYRESCS